MARMMSNTLSVKNPYKLPKNIARTIYYKCLGYSYQDPVDQELIRNTAVMVAADDPAAGDAVFKAVTEGLRYKDISDLSITEKQFYKLVRRFYYILAKRGRFI